MTAMGIRFKIDPRFVPVAQVARRLGLTQAEFAERLPSLVAAGFPSADPLLGTYCLQAVDNWIDERTGLPAPGQAMNPIAEMKAAIRGGAWGR